MNIAITSGILTSLAGRYAKALFELAKENDEVEKVGSSLSALAKLIQSSDSLKKALVNPTIQCEDQEAVLREICTRMKAPKMVPSFMGLLVKAQRIPYINRIEEIYHSLSSQAKEEQRIEVISAYPLTPIQSNLLKEKLKKIFPGTLNLTFVKDSKVLGGIMVRVGSRVIDATLVTQLNKLATAMKGSA
jgi:F-type H+-transporting ATPase subunit delta